MNKKFYFFACLLILTSFSFFYFQYLAAEETLHIDNDSEKIFTEIYDKGLWGQYDFNQNFSGHGSGHNNAIPYINFLKNFIKKYEIKSVVDVGCGDWTFSQEIDWKDIEYTGIDVVKYIIENDQKEFSSSNIKFIQKDILKDEMPSADLLLCKDVLQHLTNEDISLFLKQMRKFKYCLITNDINITDGTKNNIDINRGEYREIDLAGAPFNIKGTKVFIYSTWVYSQMKMKMIYMIRNEE